jgi:hypothetical protein
MRIYESDHAYEIERVVRPETQLTSGWRYKVYRVRPSEELVSAGGESREAAEEAGRRALAEVIRGERQRARKKPAA